MGISDEGELVQERRYCIINGEASSSRNKCLTTKRFAIECALAHTIPSSGFFGTGESVTQLAGWGEIARKRQPVKL